MFQVVCSGVNRCQVGRRELRLQGQHQPQDRDPSASEELACPLQALRESQIQSSTAQHVNQALSVLIWKTLVYHNPKWGTLGCIITPTSLHRDV